MRLAPLPVSDEDRGVGVDGPVRTAAARDVQRAWIVLLAADGWSNRAIGVEVGLHYNQGGVAGPVPGRGPGRFGRYRASRAGHRCMTPMM
jgi:hypothetical protein